jgi:hypothetical protein
VAAQAGGGGCVDERRLRDDRKWIVLGFQERFCLFIYDRGDVAYCAIGLIVR